MNELALFAGGGGGIYASLLLGHTVVAAVEIEAANRRILLQRQLDGVFPRFPIWDDVRTFNGHEWRGHVDIVSGGFPCQDISAAGTGKGLDGDRSGLWVEFARIIREVRPSHAFVENSPMLTGRGLGRVLADLAALGFDARWGVLGAAHFGAPHLRERIWILANANSFDVKRIIRRCADEKEREIPQEGPAGLLAGRGCKEWPIESAICGVAHGVAYRGQRLRALGNGQVPRVAAAAWRMLSE